MTPREDIFACLSALNLSQTNLSVLAKVRGDRLCRYIKGSLELKAAELDRISDCLNRCVEVELSNGLPVDWSRIVLHSELQCLVFPKEKQS